MSTTTVESHETAAWPSKRSSMFDLILSDDTMLDDRLLNISRLGSSLRTLILIGAFGSFMHGLVVAFAARVPGPVSSEVLRLALDPHAVFWMPIAFCGSFLIASAVALPSCYFYTQLAGIDAPMRLIAAQSLRMFARSSTLLMASAPFYLAVILWSIATDAPHRQLLLGVGVGLPFALGITGLQSLLASFRRITARLPQTRPNAQKRLLEVVAAWAALKSVVVITALFWLASKFSSVAS